MKISVIGAGYVGLSLAVLLSRKHEVVTLDVIPQKVDMINNGKSPIADKDIERCLSEGNLNLIATLDYEDCEDSDYFIIATPTDYNPETDSFDTRSIEDALDNIERICPGATVVIKSTVPIGYTSGISQKRSNINLLFSPEFLREGRSLHDNLYPSRIVVGISNKNKNEAEKFAELMKNCSLKDDVAVMITGSTEAESIKLFSNSYLALRVSFFNELDSFAEVNNLNSEEIIRGVSSDPRIGDYYNNPSFGYGGYCLPKDTMQLRSSYGNTPHTLISAVVESNDSRKRFIADRIAKMALTDAATIGAFRLNMKTGSDNDRKASIIDVIKMLKDRGFKIVVYEPSLKDDCYCGYQVIRDLHGFKKISDVIVANRISKELADVSQKVYSRDVYNRD
jgi:UDPglucose 6-dehydrogenase